VVGLLFSDVVGNDPGAVASGPISPDETTYEDALTVIEQYDVDVASPLLEHLRRGMAGDIQETPDKDSPLFDSVSAHILADNFTALTAASTVARTEGYEPLILSSHIRGEAGEVAKVHVGIAEEVGTTENPLSPPAVLLSGGETTVTVTSDGHGGPNQEFALSAALELDLSSTVVGCVDTDGIDGNSDAAGALVDANTIDDRTIAQEALASNDVYPVLDAAGALLRTGPTGTNVNDLRVIVIDDQ
jgi:hydroxypyruvate reductase